MFVTLLGTGSSYTTPQRQGPATLVEHEQIRLLVDCGAGVVPRLQEHGSSDITAVLLTHLHHDHVADLVSYILFCWRQGRTRPQRIFGPPGTRAFVTHLLEAWRPEMGRRIAFERRKDAYGLKIEVEDLEAGSRLRLEGMAVTAVQVDHATIDVAFGYLFETEGLRCAVSGDTRYSRRLVVAAREVDLLIHECCVPWELSNLGATATGATGDSVLEAHAKPEEVGWAATEIRPRSLALSHFTPARFDKRRLMRELRQHYRGPAVIGEDLMRFDLAAGTATYKGLQLSIYGTPGAEAE